MERLCWDDYFMCLALLARVRSPDESTKHGCLIIDQNHKIIGIGYNGPPSGCDDNLIPQTRPEKYDFFIHSEPNAIFNSSKLNLDGCTAYITGNPCMQCLGFLLQKGIKKIVCGPITSKSISNSKYKNDTPSNLEKFKLHNKNIVIEEWKPKNLNLISREFLELTSLLIKNYSKE